LLVSGWKDEDFQKHHNQIFLFRFADYLYGEGLRDCRLTIYHTWGIQGGFPENNTTIHWAFMASNDSLSKTTKNNPILTKDSSDVSIINDGREITAIICFSPVELILLS